MIRFMLAAAGFTLVAGTALAQTAGYDPSSMIPAEQLTDGDLYTTNAEIEWTEEAGIIEFDPNWESIGEIEDLILDQDGQVVGIVAEVGGFLGVGEHDVFIPTEDLRLVPREGEWIYVTRYTQEELEELPELDDDVWDD